MKTYMILGAAALVALAFTDPTTSGPYLDSRGKLWDELPFPSPSLSVAEFDARYAHEVFTTKDGHRLQLDRGLTDEELRVAVIQQQLNRLLQPPADLPGGALRASVSTWHPCDEEYVGSFPSGNAVRTHVASVVNSGDSTMRANWGIDLVPTDGQLWDSNDNADIGALLDEAFAENGGLHGLDMMIAFSNDPTPGGAIGVAYIGLPRQLIKKYQNLEANILEHETGHTYTCLHCCDSTCTMYSFLVAGNKGRWHNYQEGCSGQNHSSLMSAQRDRY